MMPARHRGARSRNNRSMARRAAWLAVILCGLLRFCYLDVVWVEEGYPLAAAREMLRSKALYTGIWFDKPPLFPALYALSGAQPGWPLRLFGFAFVLLAAASASWSARLIGLQKRPQLAAAALTAFFLTFDTHSAALALTPDLLTVPFHLLAVALAIAGSPLAAGLVSGLALAVNTKSLLVLAACCLWQWRRPGRLLGGFLAGAAAILLFTPSRHAFLAYFLQVWVWGAGYARDTTIGQPALEFLRRTLNWTGFHAALAIPAALALWRRSDWRWWAWTALSLAASALGLRFFPRYYFHLLPPLVLLAAEGWALSSRRATAAFAFLLLLPLARFGPRYLSTARGEPWTDLAMFYSSKQAAWFLHQHAKPGDTLLVWGYRPDLYALTPLPAGSKFLDAQPLTGVLADRHLTSSRPTFPSWAARNRQEFLSAPPPAWIADGLGPYNPALQPQAFLPAWMARYELAASLPGYRLWRLRTPGD